MKRVVRIIRAGRDSEEKRGGMRSGKMGRRGGGLQYIIKRRRKRREMVARRRKEGRRAGMKVGRKSLARGARLKGEKEVGS
jgi:hypothetical protein